MKRTLVLAIGNAGGNMAEAAMQGLPKAAKEYIRFAFADSSEQDLKDRGVEGCKVILLACKQDSFPQEIFESLDRLVILSGLGGKTGNEFVEKAINSAKSNGINSVLVLATVPFLFEGENRIFAALEAASKVEKIEGVKLITLQNEKLIEEFPELNFFEAFQKSDDAILSILQEELLIE